LLFTGTGNTNSGIYTKQSLMMFAAQVQALVIKKIRPVTKGFMTMWAAIDISSQLALVAD
jgi:hypothetical protein